MADFMFNKGLQGFLEGAIDWDTDVIKVCLIDQGVDVPVVTDQFLSDISSGARVAISPALTSKTVVDGVADAADVTLPSVTGASVESLVAFKDTGDPATSRLICKMDTYSGLPFTPNGSDVEVRFPSDANRIFKL